MERASLSGVNQQYVNDTSGLCLHSVNYLIFHHLLSLHFWVLIFFFSSKAFLMVKSMSHLVSLSYFITNSNSLFIYLFMVISVLSVGLELMI